MILQLTNAGRTLLNESPTSFTITRTDFGSGFGYLPVENPTSLAGSVTKSINTILHPTLVDANTIRYTVYLQKEVPTFTFGEVAFYSGLVLVGVAAATQPLTKQGPGTGSDGQDLRLDFFIDTQPGNTYALSVVDPAGSANSFPRVSVPDLLTPPAKNGNNAYVVYGLSANDIPYFAFSDPTGKWSFSSKPNVAYTGVVTTASALALQASVFSGSYSGLPTDCVLQFTSGELRGYCRQLTDITGLGGFQWSTPLNVVPKEGDTFIVVSPSVASGSGGLSLAQVNAAIAVALQSFLDQVNIFTKSQAVDFVVASITGTYTPNAALSNNFRLTVAASTTVAKPTNLVDGQVLNLVFINPLGSTSVLTFGSAYDFGAQGDPVLPLGNATPSLASCIYDETTDKLICTFRPGAALAI